MKKVSLLILVAACLVTACSGDTAVTPTAAPPLATAVPTTIPTIAPPATPATYTILYHVSGSALTASLTYQNATGGTEQHDVALPWERELTMKYGDFVYLSAQNNGDSGSVSCLIIAAIGNEATRVAGAVSAADYGIATCSGSVGMGN